MILSVEVKKLYHDTTPQNTKIFIKRWSVSTISPTGLEKMKWGERQEYEVIHDQHSCPINPKNF